MKVAPPLALVLVDLIVPILVLARPNAKRVVADVEKRLIAGIRYFVREEGLGRLQTKSRCSPAICSGGFASFCRANGGRGDLIRAAPCPKRPTTALLLALITCSGAPSGARMTARLFISAFRISCRLFAASPAGLAVT